MFAKSLEVHKEPCAVEIYKNIGMNATKTIVFAIVFVVFCICMVYYIS